MELLVGKFGRALLDLLEVEAGAFQPRRGRQSIRFADARAGVLQLGGGGVEVGFGRTHVRFGDDAVLLAGSCLQGGQVGLGAGQTGLGRRYFERVGRGLQVGQAGLGRAQALLGVGKGEFEVGRVELQQHVARLHHIAHAHGQVGDNARGGEGQAGLTAGFNTAAGSGTGGQFAHKGGHDFPCLGGVSGCGRRLLSGNAPPAHGR